MDQRKHPSRHIRSLHTQTKESQLSTYWETVQITCHGPLDFQLVRTLCPHATRPPPVPFHALGSTQCPPTNITDTVFLGTKILLNVVDALGNSGGVAQT